MRVMGLDYGDKTIGVAISDELGLTAQALEVIKRTTIEKDMERLREIIAEYEVSEIVVGLPKNMDASIGPRGEKSVMFAGRLREAFGLPVHLWDERLTTASAERALLEADVSRKKRKQVIDKLAASLILQSFMDSKNIMR